VPSLGYGLRVRHPGLVRLSIAFASAAACRPQETEPPELDAGEHLLVTPRGNPEDLLGRTVTADARGGFIVSDERPPGCEVVVKRVPEKWNRTYQQDAGHAAHVGTGETPIGSLEVKTGNQYRIDATVDNIEVLHADLRGCKGTVVDSVKVGTGSREIKMRKETTVDAKARVKGVPVGAGASKWRAVERAHSWNEPQAWAFTVRDITDQGDIRLDIVMPSMLHDGDTFDVQVLTSRQVFIVAGFLREDGTAGILVPRSDQAKPVITAGSDLRVRLQARSRSPGASQREKFVVFAFAEEGDFDMYRPPQGAIDDTTAGSYFQELPGRLEKGLPSRRWSSKVVHLMIEPAVIPATPDQPLVESGSG
jgi:hypothetical protein